MRRTVRPVVAGIHHGPPHVGPSAARASIVSGYFNPFHQGHLDLLRAGPGRARGYLVRRCVNNDAQQLLEEGPDHPGRRTCRARIVAALRCVDDTFARACDDGTGIDATFDAIRAGLPGHRSWSSATAADRVADVATACPEAERDAGRAQPDRRWSTAWAASTRPTRAPASRPSSEA